ncbi:MAG: septal ring lytic transglycosylase RlpA family protein, partial [Halomonas sp.]
QEVEVVINDRGPFIKGRVIDLSKRAAQKLGMLDRGVAPVLITQAD